MRVVLLCGMHEPAPMTKAERDKRWRLAHPEKVRARQERFLANNPHYHRDYWRRKNGKAA